MANPFLVLGGIAVSVITATIGVLQVPGWVASAHEAAAVNDLAAIRAAQSASQSQHGRFFTDPAALTDGSLGVKFELSGGVELAGLSAFDDAWCATVRAATGTYFSASSSKTAIGSGATAEDADIAAGCPGAEPLELAAAAEHTVPQYLDYSSSITVSGGTGPYTFEVVGGELPEGLTLETTENGGVLTGTTGFTGTHTATIQVTDARGRTAHTEVTVTVEPNPAVNPVATITGLGSQPVDISFSPDSSIAYVVSRVGKTLSLIDTATNAVANTVTLAGYPLRVAASPDGRYIAVGEWASSRRVWIYDATTLALVTTFTVGSSGAYEFLEVAWSLDGSRLYVGRENGTGSTVILIIDPAGWAVENTIAIRKSTTVFEIAPLPDGNVMADFGGTVYVADPRTLTSTMIIDGSFTGAATYSRDGIWFAGQGSLSKWDVTTGTRVRHFLVPETGTVKDMAVSPDGRWLYRLGAGNPGTLYVIDTLNETVIADHQLTDMGGSARLEVSEDGTKLYVAHNNTDGTVSVFAAVYG